MNRAPLLALALLAAAPAAARDLRLAQPIDCTLGASCFIQNYVDDDPGPGAADFTCGPLSYDGHKGTDFALPSFAAMEAGVDVLAAAPGVVLATRDGMPDTGLSGTPAELLDGRDCGNGVVIGHGDGWQTQYCHMKQGSIAVTRGDRVAMGARLGEVGYSGHTEFPHLHLSVREGSRVVDPFRPGGSAACGNGNSPGEALWITPMAYEPGGLIAVGLAGGVPGYDEIKSGNASRTALPATAEALVGWAYVFGGRAGDTVEITLTDPGGAVAFRQGAELDRTQAQLFRAAGKKTPREGWAPGDWQVTARLIRDGALLDEMHATVRLDN